MGYLRQVLHRKISENSWDEWAKGWKPGEIIVADDEVIMDSLELKNVTICAIDTRTPSLALRSLMLSKKCIKFGQVLLFTRADHGLVGIPEDVQVVEMPELKSIEDYSKFVLKGLRPYIKTSHVLLIQWDGYVINPGAWQPRFLEFDYIGAPWHRRPIDRSVGNGGFSLRSLKLLEAMEDAEFIVNHPEDLCICHTNRELLERRHVRFAPFEVAMAFSQERVTSERASFGFHGAFHFIHLLSPTELNRLMGELPAKVMCSLDIRDLVRRLIESPNPQHFETAKLVVAKRFSAGLKDWRQLRLWGQLGWVKLIRWLTPD